MHYDAPPSVFANARKLRKNMTETETKLWMYLKEKPNGYKFRRQHPIGGYILDFYCHKLKLSIELDGEYHLSEIQIKKDFERTQYLNQIGLKELRFSNNEVKENWEPLVINIEKAIQNMSQKPLPRP